LNIRYVSWVGTSGYAVAAQGYLLALLRGEDQVSWTPLFPAAPEHGGWTQAASSGEARATVARHCDDDSDPLAYNGSAARAAIDRLDGDATNVAILHVVPEAWAEHRGRETLTVGNTVWETDKLPDHWPPLLNQVDSIVVPSNINREVMVGCGVTPPIHVVPHVAPRFGPPATRGELQQLRQNFGIPDTGTLFFCCEEWNPRKATYKTLAAFLAAFTGVDDVTLVLKTSPYGARSGADPTMIPTMALVAELISTHPNPPRVIVIDAGLPRRAIEALHAMSDCYVSLSHGEGWGLGTYESVAAGNPVITTGWGGTLDYLGPGWPYLVDYDLVPTVNAMSLPSYDPTQRWAAADRDHAVKLMHEVTNRPGPARRAAAAVSKRIYEEYSPAATAARLTQAMEP
jgi:glycosyltransferase involved in cell wall biosynthesis